MYTHAELGFAWVHTPCCPVMRWNDTDGIEHLFENSYNVCLCGVFCEKDLTYFEYTLKRMEWQKIKARFRRAWCS